MAMWGAAASGAVAGRFIRLKNRCFENVREFSLSLTIQALITTNASILLIQVPYMVESDPLVGRDDPLPSTLQWPFLVQLKFLSPQQTSDSNRSDKSKSKSTQCAVEYGNQTVAEFVKHHVEEASPELWLPLICQYANSSTGVVKVCYGDGYQTRIAIGNVNQDGKAKTVTLEVSVGTTNVCDGSWVQGSEAIWDLVSSEYDSNSDSNDLCVYVRMTRNCAQPAMSQEKLVERRRNVRVETDPDDANVFVRMKERRPKLKPSHVVVLDFLDNRPDEDSLKDVEGQERADLKDRIFRHLDQKQQKSFSADEPIAKAKGEESKFDKWLSDTLRARRGTVTQPEKTRKGLDQKQIGDANSHSRELQQVHSQQPGVKAAKAKWSQKKRQAAKNEYLVDDENVDGN